jgi:peptide deformylase
MAILNILHFPDPRLRTKARPVGVITPEIQQLIDDMFETMYQAPGIGLAATQVDYHQQIIVIDVSEEDNQPLVLINPQIIDSQGSEEMDEGCLSVPGIYETVERFEKIKVQALNREGESFELEVEGLLAVCIQHEMDHLKGILFVDYLSKLKRYRLQKKFEKQLKATM